MSDVYTGLQEKIAFQAPTRPIMDMFAKMIWVVRSHEKIMVAISGGSDSDLMVDAFSKIDVEKKAVYVWFNTGLEYDATKRHLRDLESKYGITIEIINPIIPIPICCKKYGVPFWSKRVSDYIYRLQSHGFKWEDRPFEELIYEYPRCKAALKWWCNKWSKKKNGSESSFNIAFNATMNDGTYINVVATRMELVENTIRAWNGGELVAFVDISSVLTAHISERGELYGGD